MQPYNESVTSLNPEKMLVKDECVLKLKGSICISSSCFSGRQQSPVHLGQVITIKFSKIWQKSKLEASQGEQSTNEAVRLHLVYHQQRARGLPDVSNNTQMLKVKSCLPLLPGESEEIGCIHEIVTNTFPFLPGSKEFHVLDDRICYNIYCQLN